MKKIHSNQSKTKNKPESISNYIIRLINVNRVDFRSVSRNTSLFDVNENKVWDEK